MFSLIKDHPKAVLWAVIVHVIFLVTMGISFHFIDAPSSNAPEVKIVKAVLKDDSIEQKELKQKLEKEKRHKELLEKKQLEKERLEQKKLKEKERQVELKKQKLAKQQAEKLAKAKAQKEQLEKKRIEEENQRIEQQQAEQKRREDVLKKEIELEQQRLSEERKARNETIIGKQIAIIKSHIEQRWIKPASTKIGMVCIIRVSLIPSGEVINVQYIKKSGNNAFDQSVYTAVKRSSPLPLPPVEYGLSDRFRDIELNFGSPK